MIGGSPKHKQWIELEWGKERARNARYVRMTRERCHMCKGAKVLHRYAGRELVSTKPCGYCYGTGKRLGVDDARRARQRRTQAQKAVLDGAV